MTTPAEIENKTNDGLGLRITGIFLCALMALGVAGQLIWDTEPNLIPWAGLLVGLVLVGISYLQKIANK